MVPLLLVDGHNLLWRAWFGFPARIHSRDKRRDLTGVFGFFALLRVAVRELPGPPEIAVVFDGEHAWDTRTRLDPAYKAHRRTDADAMAPIRALADVTRGLELLAIRQVCIDTAEADDVIATLARRSRRPHRREVWIMSTDRDFYQLVDPWTRILNTARHPGHRIIDHSAIERRHGVRADRWCDRVSLVGDPSDGIRGVYGVGPITAARLLAGHLAVEQLPGSGRLTGAVGARIRREFPNVLRCKQLARLRSDIAVPQRILTGHPNATLPPAPAVLDRLDLW